MSRNLIVLFAILVVAPGLTTAQESEAIIPPLVIEDANNDAIGPVVGFSSAGAYPIVRIDDPGLDLPVFLKVFSNDRLEGYNSQTWFTGDNCSGTPLHRPSLTTADTGMASLYGKFYTVAEISGVQWLIRSDASDAGSATDFKSKWTTTLDTACNDTDGNLVLRSATAVKNLDNDYPTPYTIP